MNNKQTAKNAFMIGTLCTLMYLSVYIARNALSAVSPQMIADKLFTEKFIGTMASIFFFAYAIGQLVNGLIGDVIRSKYMMTIGLVLAGVSSIFLPHFYDNSIIVNILYGVVGFSLSMIYGPMTKSIAENTKPDHAIKCNLALNFAAYFGTPIAGLLALIYSWDSAFEASGIILCFMAILCFIIFSYFENKKIIIYNNFATTRTHNAYKKSFKASFNLLVERKIIKFTLVSILTGVIRTTVLFWMPTYLMQYLEFSEKNSTRIFTIVSLVISLGSFAAVCIYKLFKNSIDKTLVFSFLLAAVFFIGTFIIKQEVVNILLLIMAIMASNCAATMMWSFYCPSLADTGLVSSTTGYLDFISYMAAAISSKLFANAVADIGWSGLILVWFALMIFGIAISIPYKKRCEN